MAVGPYFVGFPLYHQCFLSSFSSVGTFFQYISAGRAGEQLSPLEKPHICQMDGLLPGFIGCFPQHPRVPCSLCNNLSLVQIWIRPSLPFKRLKIMFVSFQVVIFRNSVFLSKPRNNGFILKLIKIRNTKNYIKFRTHTQSGSLLANATSNSYNLSGM